MAKGRKPPPYLPKVVLVLLLLWALLWLYRPNLGPGLPQTAMPLEPEYEESWAPAQPQPTPATPAPPTAKPDPQTPPVTSRPAVPQLPTSPAVAEPSNLAPLPQDGLFRGIDNPQQKTIALTFDDGPWPPHTQEVLEVLQRYEAKATFFWLGVNVQKYPDLAKEVVSQGHEVGNHTFSHRTALSDDAVAQQEIAGSNQLIKEVTGATPVLFRPPGGRKNNGLNDWAKQNGYTVVMWSVQPNDWKPGATPDQIAQSVLEQAAPGRVVLLHDGGGDRSATVQALPKILEGLQSQGYRFVTVSELMAQPSQP